jgi:hypothetical protein
MTPKSIVFSDVCTGTADRKTVLQLLDGKVDEFARMLEPVYSILGWRWGMNCEIIPTAEEIARCLRGYLFHLKQEGYNDISSGGLGAVFDEERGVATISFTADVNVYFTGSKPL